MRNLVERRALVAQLVRRDFHTRYVGSAGGWAWGVIHPLVQLMVWYFIFVVCLRRHPAARHRDRTAIPCSCSAASFRGCCFRRP